MGGLATAWLFAVAVGAAIGAVGSGSMMTLPVLVYLVHLPVRTAVAVSVVVAGTTSLGAAIWYYRRGFVHRRAAVLFAASGIPASYAGSALTHLLPEPVTMLIFSALLLTAAVAMLFRPKQKAPGEELRLEVCLIAGAAVGVVTGFLGVGGGFLIVPTLALLGGMETKTAVGTALTVITLNSFAGVAGHLRFVTIDWRFGLAFVCLALMGMMVGVSLADRLSSGARSRLFSGIVTIVAIAVACESMLDLI